MNNWIEVSGEALAANLHALRTAAGDGTEVLAVVKANAYGHGAETSSLALVRAGARWLGVTCATEGMRVRNALDQAGLSAEIVIMCGFLPDDAVAIRRARLIPVLWTGEQIDWLASPPSPEDLKTVPVRVHVEIDTGMGRQGVRPGAELLDLLARVKQRGFVLDGLLTHFCSSEVAGSGLTLAQQERFRAAVLEAHAAGFAPRWIHAGNTSAIDNPAGGNWLDVLARQVGARTMVRPGLGLYGHCLPIEEANPGGSPVSIAPAAKPAGKVCPTLRPALIWKARVLAVRDLQPDETVGYGATFTAARPMRVALLPVGYADGLRRELSGPLGGQADGTGGWVMIAGERALILGRISMNLTVVDVTSLPHVAADDVAVVLGPGITADDHARLAGTIAYEILCGIHPCG